MEQIFVSGGLGGLGSVICKKFAEEACSVSFSYRKNKVKQAEEMCKELYAISRLNNQNDAQHQGIELDLLQRIDGSTLRRQLEKTGRSIRCLINCAGITRFVAHSNLEQLDDQLIDAIFSTNIKAPLVLIRELLPLLQLDTDSCIINITSVAARIAIGSNIAYCASKAALDNITRSLARALAPKIRLFSIAPGLVDTDFVSQLSEQWRKGQIEKTPLQRLASPKSVAQACYFAYKHMLDSTGSCLEIDCGRPLN